ncbi:Hsp20/alpha crystallin family protein [Azospirillum sp. RWY-5-1]|uniref:Hsp20/alpha crystallin family protein n=1 Tax=Azospirillum oleiclasticum TaxID=2735135 RepID=A0ABX2TCU0_9PROT|nr:Hsp20/alpha crystallin family protein [Azospirillum oleiclasticum]NYZ14860.1 Hsp20/alpha crystallin family protein [Azospirillum oleiclasticum]NYZ22154.1 Hsp20/alpha crystallin family protein [Azospirillum oleiclasticum]
MADTNLAERPKQQVSSTGAAATELAERSRHPFLTLRDEFDRLFDEASTLFRLPWSRRQPFDLEPMLRLGGDAGAIIPPADVEETEGEYRVVLDVPGLDETNVEVGVQDDVLSIRAEKREESEEKDKNRYLSERRYGVCARTFRLPANVDRERIAAGMKNGVLTITLPKSEPSKPSKRNIPVSKV